MYQSDLARPDSGSGRINDPDPVKPKKITDEPPIAIFKPSVSLQQRWPIPIAVCQAAYCG